MDAALAAEGLVTAVADAIGARDFEGAEAILLVALEQTSALPRAFLHLHFARLYRDWNKLTSAKNHLEQALGEAIQDPYLRLQVLDDLKQIEVRRATQRP